MSNLLKFFKTEKVLSAKKVKKFTLRSKNLLLTYNPCDLDLNNVLEQLKQRISFNTKIVDFLIVRENNTHVHCFISTSKRNQIICPNKLDLTFLEADGKMINYHGNYQSVKNKSYAMEYLLKGIVDRNDTNNIIYSNTLENQITENGNFLCFDTQLIKMARNGQVEEAMALFEKAKPAEYLRQHRTMLTNLRSLMVQSMGYQLKFSLKNFNLPATLIPTILKSFEDQKTVYLKGLPGSGKTQFILTLLKSEGFEPLVINDINSLSSFKNGFHNCIVFDDVSFKGIKREMLTTLVDSEVPTTFKVLYGSIALPITQRVIISNVGIEAYFRNKNDFKLEEFKSVFRRMNVVDLENLKLFVI